MKKKIFGFILFWKINIFSFVKEEKKLDIKLGKYRPKMETLKKHRIIVENTNFEKTQT